MKSMQCVLPCVLVLVLFVGCGGSEEPAVQLPQPAVEQIAESQPSTLPSTMPTTQGSVVAAGLLQVHDRFITVKEIMHAGRRKFAEIPPNLTKAEFRQRAYNIAQNEIRRAVSLTLVLVKAEASLTRNQKAYIDAELEQAQKDMISAAGGSIRQLEHKLSADGLMLEKLLEDHRRSLTVNIYLRGKFMPMIRVNRRMLWDYYCRHRDDYTRDKKVQLRIIAVPFGVYLPVGSANPTEEQMKLADARARELMKSAAGAVELGQDFDSLARQVAASLRATREQQWETLEFPAKIYVTIMESSGGLWDARSPESFREEALARIAGRLKDGQVSEIIQTDEALYLVKMEKILGADTVSFADAQADIENVIRSQRYARLTDEHFVELFNEFERVGGRLATTMFESFGAMVVDRVVAEYWKKST